MYGCGIDVREGAEVVLFERDAPRVVEIRFLRGCPLIRRLLLRVTSVLAAQLTELLAIEKGGRGEDSTAVRRALQTALVKVL